MRPGSPACAQQGAALGAGGMALGWRRRAHRCLAVQFGPAGGSPSGHGSSVLAGGGSNGSGDQAGRREPPPQEGGKPIEIPNVAERGSRLKAA
jgi:hypothetical protein